MAGLLDVDRGPGLVHGALVTDVCTRFQVDPFELDQSHVEDHALLGVVRPGERELVGQGLVALELASSHGLAVHLLGVDAAICPPDVVQLVAGRGDVLVERGEGQELLAGGDLGQGHVDLVLVDLVQPVDVLLVLHEQEEGDQFDVAAVLHAADLEPERDVHARQDLDLLGADQSDFRLVLHPDRLVRGEQAVVDPPAAGALGQVVAQRRLGVELEAAVLVLGVGRVFHALAVLGLVLLEVRVLGRVPVHVLEQIVTAAQGQEGQDRQDRHDVNVLHLSSPCHQVLWWTFMMILWPKKAGSECGQNGQFRRTQYSTKLAFCQV